MFVGTIVLAAAGAALRHFQLTRAYDELGLPLRGSGWTVALCALALVAVAGALLLCGGMADRPEFARCFAPRRGCFAASVVAALALLAGSGMKLFAAMPGPGEAFSVLTVLPGFFGILGALGILLSAVGRMKGAKPMCALYLLPFFFLALRLIADFKGVWSSDPSILDYCFDLFAMLAALTATYHLAGFCFDRGRRARTTFWCLTGAFFCAIALADGAIADRLHYGALALWLLVNAWQLLGPAAPRAQAAAEPFVPEEPDAPDAPAPGEDAEAPDAED